MLKAIIFDLFGTLSTGTCDPEQRIMDHFALTDDYKFVERLVCGTKFQDMGSYVATIIRGLQLPDTLQTKKILKDIFEREGALDKIKPEVPELLGTLKNKGYKLGIISNIANPLFDKLGQHNIKHYFDSIIYSYEVGMTKQNPAIFTTALSSLDVQPSEAYMVGDSMNSDIVPAESLGIRGIWLDAKNKDPTYPRRITTLSELLHFLSK